MESEERTERLQLRRKQMCSKIRKLFSSANTNERMALLLEIRWNRLLFSTPVNPACSIDFNTFLLNLKSREPLLSDICKSGGEAENTVAEIRRRFDQKIQGKQILFPLFFNADISLAMLCYGITLVKKPSVVLEAGIGYGIVSTTILEAMKKNQKGTLISVDLPPLGDPSGSLIGISVPHWLQNRWQGGYRGGVRKWLPVILQDVKSIDLFVSDSANVFTLERYEFLSVWPKLSSGGVMIFNNINKKFLTFLREIEDMDVHVVRQIEKNSSSTAVIFKRVTRIK